MRLRLMTTLGFCKAPALTVKMIQALELYGTREQKIHKESRIVFLRNLM